MAKKQKNHSISEQSKSLNISEEQVEILARRLLPQIKKILRR